MKFAGMVGFNVNLPQTSHWEEGGSTKELPPSDWPVGVSVEVFPCSRIAAAGKWAMPPLGKWSWVL